MENGKQEPPQGKRKKVGDFTQLRAWQAARQLRAQLYRLTRGFPDEEKFGLAAQIRRAAVSVTANLAEGYGRFSYQENIQFCVKAVLLFSSCVTISPPLLTQDTFRAKGTANWKAWRWT